MDREHGRVEIGAYPCPEREFPPEKIHDIEKALGMKVLFGSLKDDTEDY